MFYEGSMLTGVHRIRKAPKHWVDSIKEDCGTLGVTITQASRITQVRNNWKTPINGLPMHCWGIYE